MTETEVFTAWTEGWDRMDEWNLREIELSSFFAFVWGKEWWLNTDHHFDWAQWWHVFLHVLRGKVDRREGFPAWTVSTEVEYRFFEPEPTEAMGVRFIQSMPIWGEDGVALIPQINRIWQKPRYLTEEPTIVAVNARIKSINLTSLDPRSISEVRESG